MREYEREGNTKPCYDAKQRRPARDMRENEREGNTKRLTVLTFQTFDIIKPT